MKYFTPDLNQNFIGRELALKQLRSIANSGEASSVVVTGRRRIGKTELIEQAFHGRNILKFEGIQVPKEVSGSEVFEYQMNRVLLQLSEYAEDSKIARLKIESWYEFFRLLNEYIQEKVITLYFEEVQWLANYHDFFFAELKPVWDNNWRYNKNLTAIFCGSAPSFLKEQLLSNKAFYNRSTTQIHLKGFSLKETKEFLGDRYSHQEILLAHILSGGVPEYLKYLQSQDSIMNSIAYHSFRINSFFALEKEKIFVSSLKKNPHFEKTLDYLSSVRCASRKQVTGQLGISAGGTITNLLKELELCGFISTETPAHLKSNSSLVRYSVADNYLHFYYHFIESILSDVQSGRYEQSPIQALSQESFQKWCGYAFERYIRSIKHVIAQKLGFGDVRYRAGSIFTRSNLHDNGSFQIDLIFIRADHVISLCEIKYYQSPIGATIIEDFEEKIEQLKKTYPKVEKYSIQKVLISPFGASKKLLDRFYFDKQIILEELF